MFNGIGTVAVAGSRRLPPGGAAIVAQAIGALVSQGHGIAVGCCSGVDAAAIATAPVAACQVFAAFGNGGQGACSVSAVPVVQRFAALGGAVSWWAGGGSGLPLTARLHRRTRAVINAATSGAVVVFASPSSRGSQLAASLAVQRGLPAIAIPLVFSASHLPALCISGAWVSAHLQGCTATVFRFHVDQKSLI